MKFGLMAVAGVAALLSTVSISNAAPVGRLGISGTDSAVIQVGHDDDDVGYRHRRHRGAGIVLNLGDGDNGYRHRRHWRHHDDDDNGYRNRRHWRHNSDNNSGFSIRLGSGHRRHHVE